MRVRAIIMRIMMIMIVKVSNEERNDHSSDNKFNDDNHHTFDIPIKQYIVKGKMSRARGKVQG